MYTFVTLATLSPDTLCAYLRTLLCVLCAHTCLFSAPRACGCVHTLHATALRSRLGASLSLDTHNVSLLFYSLTSHLLVPRHTLKYVQAQLASANQATLHQPISDLSYMKTCSDLVVRRGRGELHVACYQIWMNPLNVTLNLIRCSLRRRVQRRLHERAATPDFTDPIHSRLQALARTNRPARAHIHTGISGATGDEREA